jgi:hypothetical protein
MEKTTLYNEPKFNFSISQDAKIRLLLISTALASTSTVSANAVEPLSNQISHQWEWPLHKVQHQTSRTTDVSDADIISTMLDMYVEHKPVRSYKVRGKIKSVRKGQMPLHPDEF